MDDLDELEKQGEPEVRKRLPKGGYGQPGSQNYEAVKEWLRGKERERGDSLNTRRESREEESLSISRKAQRISKWALIIAIVAIICSTVTAIFIAMISKP
jgi:hypothetical protein